MTALKSLARWMSCLLLGGLASSAALAEQRTMCVYDPAGRSGAYAAMLEDFALEAQGWGVDLKITTYTDEETASKDYEAGKCDGVVATGARLQRFNRFPSTIEAIGALPDYELEKQLINSFVKYPSAAARLRSGEHETVGFIPIGAVYLFVRDREVDTVKELGGKRIATLSYDKASTVMVDRVGAIMVPVDLGSVGPKFNNGEVDACYTPAAAYQPFELWRGLEPNGGIMKLPLAQGTFQVMVRHERFPDAFGEKSRAWLAKRFDKALKLIEKAEEEIPAKYWIPVPEADLPAFEELFLSVRLNLRDEHKAYDANLLGVMRKLRCGQDPDRAECVEKKE